MKEYCIMIWICIMILILLIGIGIGVTIMYYKDRHLLNNHKILYNELQNNKIKFDEYQKRLNDHFTYNIDLLDKIAENYRNLHQNMIKNANFFLPNTNTKHNTYKTHEEYLPIEVPRDYSENTEFFQKEKNDAKSYK